MTPSEATLAPSSPRKNGLPVAMTQVPSFSPLRLTLPFTGTPLIFTPRGFFLNLRTEMSYSTRASPPHEYSRFFVFVVLSGPSSSS